MPYSIAALLNGRARKVTPKVVRTLAQAIPSATILVSHDLEQARRHVRTLIAEKPDVILSGGGDGAAMRLLNLWREEGGGPFPVLGILRLGTGNGWARVTGAPEFSKHAAKLARLTGPLPEQDFALIETEGHLCHFAGVGWDARIVNDYQRNLDKRSSQLVGSRLASWLHKGVRGYLYSVARLTIPEEWARHHREGYARAILESDGKQLYEGPVSVGAGATIPEWGYGFKAFPHARELPGRLNVRIYGGHVLDAVKNVGKLWRGEDVPDMHDFFVTSAKLRFSRPMPFQIGGDPMGEREEITLSLAKETVRVVDWRAAG